MTEIILALDVAKSPTPDGKCWIESRTSAG
jgi:hypothetical protein